MESMSASAVDMESLLDFETTDRWSVTQVLLWLEEEGFRKHKQKFLDNGIDGETILFHLTKQDLSLELHITGLLDRKKIWDAVERLRSKVLQRSSAPKPTWAPTTSPEPVSTPAPNQDLHEGQYGQDTKIKGPQSLQGWQHEEKRENEKPFWSEMWTQMNWHDDKKEDDENREGEEICAEPMSTEEEPPSPTGTEEPQSDSGRGSPVKDIVDSFFIPPKKTDMETQDDLNDSSKSTRKSPRYRIHTETAGNSYVHAFLSTGSTVPILQLTTKLQDQGILI
eukprot:gene13332-539_t